MALQDELGPARSGQVSARTTLRSMGRRLGVEALESRLLLAIANGGDFNGDLIVAAHDYFLVYDNWGASGSEPIEGWNGMPLDDRVDQNELDAVLLNWLHVVESALVSAGAAASEQPLDAEFEDAIVYGPSLPETTVAASVEPARLVAFEELYDPCIVDGPLKPELLLTDDDRSSEAARDAYFAMHAMGIQGDQHEDPGLRDGALTPRPVLQVAAPSTLSEDSLQVNGDAHEGSDRTPQSGKTEHPHQRTWGHDGVFRTLGLQDLSQSAPDLRVWAMELL